MQKSPKKISKKRLALLREMVSICSTVYNDYIQNYGPGGEYEGSGRQFDYPTRGPAIPDVPDKLQKKGPKAISAWREEQRDAQQIAHYFAFGANQMPIYLHMNTILTILEEKYGLQIEE